MTRREWLKTLSGSAILAGISGFQSCTHLRSRPAKNIQWAQGSLLWSSYSGRDIPLTEVLNELESLGCDGIEYAPGSGGFEAEGYTRESFTRSLKDRNLVIPANYLTGNFFEVDRKEEFINQALEMARFVKEFGGRNIVIGPAWMVEKPSNSADLIRKQGSVLNEIGQKLLETGVKIGIHPHVVTLIETPEEIDIAMESTDPRFVGLAPDTGHIYMGGGDVVSVMRKYVDRINYIHLKDAVRPYVRPDFSPCIRELGRGEVDLAGVRELLLENNYTGWITIEQDRTTLTPGESARINMEYVRKNWPDLV